MIQLLIGTWLALSPCTGTLKVTAMGPNAYQFTREISLRTVFIGSGSWTDGGGCCKTTWQGVRTERGVRYSETEYDYRGRVHDRSSLIAEVQNNGRLLYRERSHYGPVNCQFRPN